MTRKDSEGGGLTQNQKMGRSPRLKKRGETYAQEGKKKTKPSSILGRERGLPGDKNQEEKHRNESKEN